MDDKLASQIGRVARSARLAQRLTQEDLAENIGVSTEFYSRIERGVALPSVETLTRLAPALRVSVDALLGLGAGAVERKREPSPVENPDLRRLNRRLHGASSRLLKALVVVADETARQRRTRSL